MICDDCTEGADKITLALSGQSSSIGDTGREHLWRNGARGHARCRTREAKRFDPGLPGQLPRCACQHRVPSKP